MRLLWLGCRRSQNNYLLTMQFSFANMTIRQFERRWLWLPVQA
jgi:hypothetical protein